MTRRILLIQGHPGGSKRHFGHALAATCAGAGAGAGPAVRPIDVAGVDFPFGAEGLTGRSARPVVATARPAPVFRFDFRAHGVKSLACNGLGFVGIAPVSATPIGAVDRLDEPGRARGFVKRGAIGRGAG